MHADWWGPLEDGYVASNSCWLLDDFTPENGATRLVPGTHRGTQVPSDVMTDPSAPHPDEKVLRGKAGDVVVVAYSSGEIFVSGANTEVKATLTQTSIGPSSCSTRA